MHVLVVIPDAGCRDGCVAEWQARIPPDSAISFLSLKKERGTASQHGTIHCAEYNFPAGGQVPDKYITRYTSWRGLFHSHWEKVIGRQMHELMFCIRSFDPDVVDIRPLGPAPVLAAELSKNLHPVGLVSGAGADVPPDPRPLARTYDPDKKVSIVLPVYNGEQFLRQSIESCLAQTHRNLELIIVDDCSTDSSPEIARECARSDPRISVIRTEKNRRLPGALNAGFSLASGDYLTWTSDDNYFAPAALETLVRYLCTWPDIGFVYSAFRLVGPSGTQIDYSGNPSSQVFYREPPWQLPSLNVVGPYFMYTRRVHDLIGSYDEAMEYMEDYDYWLRVYTNNVAMMRLHAPLYWYRHHKGSMTTRAKNFDKGFWERIRKKHAVT